MDELKLAPDMANRFREILLNSTWIANTNYKHQLQDLSWHIAVTAIGSANTIAILAQHIHYYINGIKNVLTGGILDIKDQYSFHFPPIHAATDWEKFLNRFWADAEDFALKLEVLSNEKMNDVFVDEKYGTYKRNIEAMIEHSYYHLGQIVLLKKLLTANT